MENKKGFTLIELVIVVAIFIILIGVVIANFALFNKKTDLNNASREFESILKIAQNKATGSETLDNYGVYINTSALPHQYVLFKGSSYESRTQSADQTYSLPSSVEFYDIDLVPAGYEIVFSRPDGAPEESGSISLRLKSDIDDSRTIYIASSVDGDDRVIDTRTVNFVFTKPIDTDNDVVTLAYGDNTTDIIPISSFISTGQLHWENETGIEVDTIYINTPNTLFTIHRDGRLNNQALEITISGDTSGYLVSYLADGSDANTSSIYVTDFQIQ